MSNGYVHFVVIMGAALCFVLLGMMDNQDQGITNTQAFRGQDFYGAFLNFRDTRLMHVTHVDVLTRRCVEPLKATGDAFNASVDGGLTFFDIAEVYGSGSSSVDIRLDYISFIHFLLKENDDLRKKIEVFVANHTSMIDFIFLEQIITFAVIIQKHPG
ncbi:hypothetical protein VNO77_44440 [Canavalia gladiata]|uniref:NADP-dependent oxidoreductase domain-containing protein n=1 Tax=Canavalia gladiata TaxID=3824 RepID=A0AAN9JY66_CANGL